jgi:hypothetical protein
VVGSRDLRGDMTLFTNRIVDLESVEVWKNYQHVKKIKWNLLTSVLCVCVRASTHNADETALFLTL